MKKPSYLSWVEAASIPEVFLTGERRTCAHTYGCVDPLKHFRR